MIYYHARTYFELDGFVASSIWYILVYSTTMSGHTGVLYLIMCNHIPSRDLNIYILNITHKIGNSINIIYCKMRIFGGYYIW